MATDDLNSGLGLGDGTGMSEEALGSVAKGSSAFEKTPTWQPKPDRREPLIDEAAGMLARKSEAERNRAYLDEARSLHDESQQAFRHAQANGDDAGMERALRHIGVASQRLADEEFRVESDRLGIKRSMSDEQGRRLDAAIAEQKKIVDYLDDLVTKGSEDPSFIPHGQSLDDWKRNLQSERKALNQLTVGREAGRQRAAVEDPSFIGETARGFATGMLGTGSEMLGGALKQAGATSDSPILSDAGEAVRAFGKGIRQDTAAQSSPEVLKLGEKGEFLTELKNYVGAKLGEGLGTSVPIIAAAIAGGPIAGVGAGVTLGIGQMRNALEEAFASEGIDFPEEKAAFYVYTYGTAIGALESAMEVMGVSTMTGAFKQQAVRGIAQTIAKGAAKGAALEGITETLQELVEIVGVSQATDKPVDWTEARRRMIEAGAAGAVPGTAFGTVTSTVERQGALDAALKKADSLGFRQGGQPATEARSETAENFRPISDQGQAAETVRDVSPSLDPDAAPGKGPSVRMAQADPVLDEARSIIDQVAPPADVAEGGKLGRGLADIAKQPGAASDLVARVAGALAEGQIPTFQQVLQALPKDQNGDPDVSALMERVTEFGAKAWGGLTDEQKTEVYQRFAPVIERAAPIADRVADAIRSGEAGEVVRGIAQRVVAGAQEAAGGQIDQGRANLPPPRKPAPARTEAQIKAAFDKVLASKAKRSAWASEVGVDQAQLDGLISEALKDGRLKKTKAGGIVRTAKAKAAAADDSLAGRLAQAKEKIARGAVDMYGITMPDDQLRERIDYLKAGQAELPAGTIRDAAAQQIRLLEAELATRSAGQATGQPAEYLALKAQRGKADAEAAAASAALNAFPKGAMGMTPDAVKATPEFQAARDAYRKAADRLRAINKAISDRFAKEAKEDRDAARAARVVPSSSPAIDRPTEVRANSAKNDIARRYALEIAEAGNTESLAGIIDRLKAEKKGTLPALSEIVKILTGTASKAKSKAAVYAQIETAVGKRLAKPAPAITTEASGQTSLVPEITDKDRLKVAAGKALRGGNAPADFGLFGSGSQQLDLVEMTKAGAQKSARATVAKEPKPVSLINFLRARGGINDDGGDLRAMEAHMRPGLVNYRNGLTLDHAREIAAEAGYLKESDAGLAQTSTADLLEAIAEELAGRPTYSTADASRVADMRQELKAEIGNEIRNAYVERLQDWHEENGLSFRMTEREIDRAYELMSKGTDINDAVEAAFIEAVEDETQSGTAPRDGGTTEEDGVLGTFDDGAIATGGAGGTRGGVRAAGGEGTEAEGIANAPSRDAGLERDWRDGPPQDGLGEADVPAAAGRDGEGTVARGEGAVPQGSADGGLGVSDGDATALGAGGNSPVQSGAPGIDRRSSGRGERAGSGDAGQSGVPAGRAPASKVVETAADTSPLVRAIEAQRQADETVSYVANDPENIRASLPLLKPAQRDDVVKAEARFSQPDGYGFLFTNGTGTGKTFTGLGVIKRFVKQGKSNILILAPSQGILDGWIASGRMIGIDISRLPDTGSAGEGVVATTYANLRENPSLVNRQWDLLVADEAHHLSQNASGNASEALNVFRALANKSPYTRAALMMKPQADALDALREASKADQSLVSEYDQARSAHFQAVQDLAKTFEGQPRAKALFLSATPFAYRKNTDWAEGFLLSYPETKGRYNDPGGQAEFLVRNFGYNMRYNRAEEPGPEVNVGVLERDFYERLKREGVLSGRRLDVDADYDRRFVLVDDAVGAKIDQAMNWLSTEAKGRYYPLAEKFREKFNYLAQRRLLEAIKAKHVIPRIKRDIDLGRKVVVFHDYNEGGGINAFDAPDNPNERVRAPYGEEAPTIGQLYHEFIRANPYVKNLNFAQFNSPIVTLTAAFPQALVYNGRVPNKQRARARDEFNQDGSGRDIIIVQSAAGEAGISLHDTTGKHQRVLYNLGLPTRPTTAIQQEGRIYREGQVSDAILRYMSTGTGWERTAFSQTIAERASTAENLALGDEARALREAFVDAFNEADTIEQGADEGRGGKQRDRSMGGSVSPWERAKAFYFAEGKKRGRRDQREGSDYYATPEPIGLKMVEFADAQIGERILEPSAGHGAIARWFPEGANRFVIEASPSLASRAGLASPGAKVIVGRFEDHYIGNKYDAIVMNPPFGSGGKTAIEHLQKAVGHLRDGGRVVVIIPRGGMADRRLEAFRDDDANKNIYTALDIEMPPVMFERAGTRVATRLIVLEKHANLDQAPNPLYRDLSDAETINELFDRIEGLSLSERRRNGAAAARIPQVIPTTAARPAEVTPTATVVEPTAATTETGAAEADESPVEQPTLTSAPQKPAVKFKLGEAVHGKTGADLFVASIAQFVPRETYERLRDIAKKHGGYYSTFRGSGAIPGFQFASEAARTAFLKETAAPPEAAPQPSTTENTEGRVTPALPDSEAQRAVDAFLAKKGRSEPLYAIGGSTTPKLTLSPEAAAAARARIAAFTSGQRPKAPQNAVHEPFEVSQDLSDWLGMKAGAKITAHLEHIANKRAAKDNIDGGAHPDLDSIEKVRAFIEDTLANGSYAMKYEQGEQWNVLRQMPNGEVRTVGLRLDQNRDGAYEVKTAFVARRDVIPGRLEKAFRYNGGIKALKWKRDPAAFGRMLADVRQLAQRVRDPSINKISAELTKIQGEIRARSGKEEDRLSALDGGTPSLMTEARARRAARAALKMGRAITLSPEVRDAMRAAMRQMPDILPTETKTGFLVRVSHNKGNAKNPFRGHFELADGSIFPFDGTADAFLGTGALYLKGAFGDTFVLHVKYAPPGADGLPTLAGRRWHESIHVLYGLDLFDPATWGRLLGHAGSVGVLDMKLRSYLTAIGEESDPDDARTIRDAYEDAYRDRMAPAQLQDALEQESVAIMTELLVMGVDLPLPESIRRILSMIETGEMARGVGVAGGAREGALAALRPNDPAWSPKELLELARSVETDMSRGRADNFTWSETRIPIGSIAGSEFLDRDWLDGEIDGARGDGTGRDAVWQDLINSGFTDPIVVSRDAANGKYQIWDGHHRIAAAVARGERDVPAVVGNRKPATLAALFSPESFQRRDLARHFGATRIEDIGPNDPHPGRVLARDGSVLDVQNVIDVAGPISQPEMDRLASQGFDAARYRTADGWEYQVFSPGHVISATSGETLFALGGGVPDDVIRQIADRVANDDGVAGDRYDLEGFAAQRLRADDGATLSLTNVYEAYVDWVDAADNPLSLPEFRQFMSGIDFRAQKIAGRQRYVGWRLATEAEQAAAAKAIADRARQNADAIVAEVAKGKSLWDAILSVGQRLMRFLGRKSPEEVAAKQRLTHLRAMQIAIANDNAKDTPIYNNVQPLFALGGGIPPDLSDTATGQSMRRDLDNLGFYSKALEAARGLKQAKGTPEQMLAQLKKAGVKDAEIEATGFKGLLDGKTSVTRDEIIAHLEGNRIGLREVQRVGSAERGVRAADLERQAREAEDRGDTAAANRLWNESEALFMDAGDANEPKWAAYSLDPANPTYRETVLHLPESEQRATRKALEDKAVAKYGQRWIEKLTPAEMDELEAATKASARTDFRSGHFPEPNIVGHMMTSMVEHEGKPVYLIDQIQSDWGQRLRDGGARDEAKIAAIERQLAEIGDVRSEMAALQTDLYGPQAMNIADYPNRIAEFLDKAKAVKPEFAGRIETISGRVQNYQRLMAELGVAKTAAPGHPLVNTTDQWVNTTLRRAIRQAAEANADYIAIPHGDTVLSYNPGDEKGMRGFYGSRETEGIVPKNLRKLLQAFDKKTPAPERVEKLETTHGPEGWQGEHKERASGRRLVDDRQNHNESRIDKSQTGFTLFPLTNVLKWAVKAEGQPLFALGGGIPPDLSDTVAGQSMRRDLDDLGYYSKALEAARGLKQAKGTPEQMLAQLKKAGVKDAEIEATGLATFRDEPVPGKPGETRRVMTPAPSLGMSITRDEIIAHLEGNRIGLREVVGAGSDVLPTEATRDRAVQVIRDVMEIPETAETRVVDLNGIVAEVSVRTPDGWDFIGTVQSMGGNGGWYPQVPGQFRDRMASRRRVDGAARLAKFSNYSLDPSNPTYRETVLHLPGMAVDQVSAQQEALVSRSAQLRSDLASLRERLATERGVRRLLPGHNDRVAALMHESDRITRESEAIAAETEAQGRSIREAEQSFQSGHFPEPNIIGHMMTSLTTLPPRVVKDAEGQVIESGLVYTIDQIQSDWGQKLRDGGVRDEAKLAELKRQIADIDPDGKVAAYDSAKRSMASKYGDPEWMTAMSPVESQRMQELGRGREEVRQRNELLEAELRTAEAATPGNPLVNTTDQWVNTTLRRAIRQAVEAGADYIAIPSGDTVLSYNPGDEAGMRGFYGSRESEGIVPKNLRKLLEKIDPKAPKPIRTETLDSPSGKTGLGKGFTLFPLTNVVKLAVKAEGQPLFALGGGVSGSRQPTPPDIATQPAPDDGLVAPALNAVIQKLKDSLNVIPTQTLLGVRIRAEDGSEVRLNPRRNVRGQTQSATAAVGVRKSRQIDVIAHEMAHALEVTLGADILDLQIQHRVELEAMSPGATLSEAFADWFSYYITSGPSTVAPALTQAFEDVIEANAPEMLEGIHEAQAMYQDWLKRSSPEALASDVVSTYAGNSWTDIAANDTSLSETIAGKMAGAYSAVIDDLSPFQKMVRRLLETADRNGVTDDAGRPISLGVAENPYKIARMFRGSYATGYSWLKNGIANRGETTVSFPGLSKALETLFGTSDQKAWDPAMYQAAGNYLIAKRAVAEYDRLERKEARLADIDDLMQRGALARQQTAAERDRVRGMLERRQDALTRAEALMRDRRNALRSAESTVSRLQERIQDKKDDVLAAQMARDAGLTARRQRDLARLERDSQVAVQSAAAVLDQYETLTTEIALLNAEIEQRRAQVEQSEARVQAIGTAVDGLARERKATAERGASRPPTKESRDHWLDVIAKTEADPKYARIKEFAEQVYQFSHGLLTLRKQAGFLNDDQYVELTKRKGWYVPFQRDMSDASPETVFGGGTKKWSPFKKFDGSDRAIINPLETLASDAYATAQQIAFNDASGALAALAERAGPGAASIAHVLSREESAEANAATFDRIRDIALSMGIDSADADRIVHQMEQNFAGEQLSLMWSPATKGPVSLPTIPLWRNGERIMVRLTDPEFGMDAFNALSGLGKENSNMLVEFFATPARLLQMGVTTHPTFMPRNLFRDIFDAWIKTGALPIATQIKGAAKMRDAEFMRRYYEAGGIVGGRNVAALTSKEQQTKVLDLGTNRISRGSIVLGAIGGGLLGTLYGGPIGGVAGALAGGYALRRGEVLKAIEAVETMTRVGVASHAYKRALEHNPDLSETEAMLEAAFVARDVFDWNRRGSKMLAVVRGITFLNAQIQGLDSAARRLGGDSDRGSVLARHLGMVWKRENGAQLSAEDERELGNAYKTWARMGAYTLGLLSLYALATSGDDDDDKRYQDVRDKTKATHSWLPNVFGVDFRLPKAFEWAMPANVVEAIADKVRGRDPRAWDRVIDSTYEVMAPPLVPQALSLIVGLTTNAQLESLAPWVKRLLGHEPENASPKQIVGDNLARLDPESQFDAFSSQLSIDIAKSMVSAGVPRDLIPSPKKIDFILRSGGYWGQDIAKGYGIVREGLGFRPREAPRVSDIPVVAGFTGVAARQSKSRDELFKLMMKSGGVLTTAAGQYKNLIDQEGVPREAERYLSRLDPEERAYAILKYYGSSQQVKDHPLERLLSVDNVLSKIRKDMILDRLTPTHKEGNKTKRDWDGKISLSPRKQTEIHDIIERLQQSESWNTMVLMKRPGWEGKTEIATKPILDELKASSPKVFELFEDRLQAARAREFSDVKQDWPDLRARILRDGVGAF